jgi:L-lysine exporter family protein LysE/ArgO
MQFDFRVYGEGLSLGLGLIIAIGAQNAFVLKQGIARRYVFATALICSCIDGILITAGVLGLGAIINGTPLLLFAVTAAGTAFLLWYGVKSFVAVFNPAVFADDMGEEGKGGSLRSTLLALLAFSLLNPHVYLDTVIMVGGIGARHPAAQRPSFVLGAASASAIWFFGLAYGAGFLAPLFKKKITWRVLDFAIGCVMLFIAAKLGIFAVHEWPRVCSP